MRHLKNPTSIVFQMPLNFTFNMLNSLFLVLLLFQEVETVVHFNLARAAFKQVGVTVLYTPGYVRIPYPNGDVPQDRGVCTDVIIRAFRKIGIDLQKEVHEDMNRHFNEYPNFWNLKRPDRNIDHRRVPNLITYFKRKGKSVSLTDEYKAGDIVAWLLPSGLYHIGIVAEEIVPGKEHRYIIHNIGAGVKMEDVLNEYKIIGHYRW